MPGSGTYELTMILGAAALLLWGVRMARTGVMRVYGMEIRKLLPRALKNRWLALLIGAGAATVLQSSIAVAVFTSTLAAVGVIPLAEGLLLMLGADVGSAIVAALLTLNLKVFWPILMFGGYLVHSIYRDSDSPGKQFGRISLGIAMILIALTFMGQVSSGLSSSDLIITLIGSLGSELFIAVLLFAILTWLAHSSIAILLFWAALVQAGITTDTRLIVACILGINLGNAIPPIILMWSQAAPARRIVVGNAVFKLIGVVICFLLIPFLDGLYRNLPGEASFRVVILHILFNTLLVMLFAGAVRPIAVYLNKFFIDAASTVEQVGPKYIPAQGNTLNATEFFPVSALSREVLRILGSIQNMLELTLEMLIFERPDKVQEIVKIEEKVNILYKAVRSYAIELTRKGLDDADQRRVTALLRYTASLENAGDVVCKAMIGIPDAMKKDGKRFSAEGKDDLGNLFCYLIGNAQLAAEVVMAWREENAEALISRKREFKKMCHTSSKQHIARLSEGISHSIESSGAHLDLVADMRWINTQIASIGYDIFPEVEVVGDEITQDLVQSPE